VLVAGLDSRGLLLEAPMLLRDGHAVEQAGSARHLRELIASRGPRLVVLAPSPDMPSLPEAIRSIRSSSATRQVSLLVIMPAAEPVESDGACIRAGANAVLRRPLDYARLESWLCKLLIVPRRVQARFPVQGQVVGSRRDGQAGHFYGLMHNVSINGMLLASPVPLPPGPDLELEFCVPGVGQRMQALARVVREAPEVAWPYLGYGVEFLFVPPDCQDALVQFVADGLAHSAPPPRPDRPHGIHSTLCREGWVYELQEPIARGSAWQVEIRRSPREQWRPGQGSPFYVVEGRSREDALSQARGFIDRHG
jgi:CheY-like chemotaxis protein